MKQLRATAVAAAAQLKNNAINPRNGLTKLFYESILRTFFEVLRYGLTKLFNNIVNPFRGLLFSAHGVSALRPKF